MSDRLLEAVGPDGLPLFACVSPSVRFTVPSVCDRRGAAWYKPFRDEEAATAALVAAGGEDVREWRR